MMHTLIFLTICAWIDLNSGFHTTVNARYEDTFTNGKQNRGGRASTAFELLKQGISKRD